MALTEQRKQYMRRWCKAQPEKRYARYFRARMRNKYGMPPERYDCLLLAQQGKCLICKGFMHMPSKTDRTRKGDSVVVDHDHATNEVRGLLCNNCNRGLGLFRHNPEVLANAQKYMESWNRLRGEQ